MTRIWLFLFNIVLLLSFFGCSSVTKQSSKNVILDASQESSVEGTGTSSADIRSMAERMARDISGVEWPKNLDLIRIALVAVDNQTRFALNPHIIQDRLLTDLVEFSAGSKMRFSENVNGASYRLTTRITALSKGSSEGVSDYLLYSFKLVDQSDTIVWAKAYETKKQGKVGVMYR